MLSMKGKYGLKAMCYLAGLPAGKMAQSSEIAEANSISKKFLDAILADLRHAGLVHARKGRSGGYILRVLDGPLAPIHCASRTAYHRCQDCPAEDACSVRLTMLEVREAIASILDTKSIASMRTMAEDEERETTAVLHVS